MLSLSRLKVVWGSVTGEGPLLFLIAFILPSSEEKQCFFKSLVHRLCHAPETFSGECYSATTPSDAFRVNHPIVHILSRHLINLAVSVTVLL